MKCSANLSGPSCNSNAQSSKKASMRNSIVVARYAKMMMYRNPNPITEMKCSANLSVLLISQMF